MKFDFLIRMLKDFIDKVVQKAYTMKDIETRLATANKNTLNSIWEEVSRMRGH